jgi:hypothetical protein
VQGIYFSLSSIIDTEGKVLQEFGRVSPKKKRSVKYALAVYESSLRCLVSCTLSLPLHGQRGTLTLPYKSLRGDLSAASLCLCPPITTPNEQDDNDQRSQQFFCQSPPNGLPPNPTMVSANNSQVILWFQSPKRAFPDSDYTQLLCSCAERM